MKIISHLELMVTHLIVGLVTVVNDHNVTTASVVTQFPCILHCLCPSIHELYLVLTIANGQNLPHDKTSPVLKVSE